MRILFASRRPCYPLFLGGAELSTHYLAAALADDGCEVRVLGETGTQVAQLLSYARANGGLQAETARARAGNVLVPTRHRYAVPLAPRYHAVITTLADYECMCDETLAAMQPHVVVTQLDGALDTLRLASNRGIPVVHCVRDVFNPTNLLPLLHADGYAPPPARIVANSHFTADHVQTTTGHHAHVIYPIVPSPPERRLPAGRSADRRSALFVNPSPSKGSEVIHEVAAAMPTIPFTIAPGWGRTAGPEWRALPNVHALAEPVPPDTLYSSIDIVLVPSQKPEGFGRVAIEAQAMGRPVLAADHSGLAESLGRSALLVSDYANPDAWIAAIRRVLDDRSYAAHLRRAGLRNAQRFAPAKIAPRFRQLLEEAAS